MNWYAIQTRSRHEKVVDRQLQERGIVSFLPVVTQVQRWSDRRKRVQFPLFPGYTFVRLAPSPEQRVEVLRVDGVVSFVGMHGQGVTIPEEQIATIKTLVSTDVPVESHPFLQVGQRVRVRGGSLDGVQGILVCRDAGGTLVISIDAIQRSLSIRVEGYDVEPV